MSEIIKSGKLDLKPIEVLLGLLFLVAPFHSWPNAGGRGLELPFNYGVWFAVALIISYGIISVVKRNTLVLPVHYLTIIAFPVLIIVSGALAGVVSPIEWFFRQIYIVAGVLFLFSLFQFRNQIKLERLLLIIVISTLFHTVISLLQVSESTFMAGWYPQDLREPLPIGIFQHVNLQASYLSTGILTAFYLQLRLNRNEPVLTRIFLVITIGLASYSMIATGSRVAILGILLGLPLLIASSSGFVRKNLRWFLLSVIFLGGGGYYAKTDLGNTIDKSAKLVEGEYSAARLSIYKVSFDAIKDSPVYGHGIGGFLKAWNDNAAAFYEENENAAMPNYITHPHNELLFWLIEGGVIAVVGIISAFIAVCIALYRMGWSQGGALAALIIPIALHTQVELPFYISAIHWFLWLALIYIILSNYSLTKQFNLSKAAEKLVYITVVGLFGLSSYSLLDTAKAQQEIFQFTESQNGQAKLERALSNLYSLPQAEKIAMRTVLYSNLKGGDEDKILPSIRWAERYVEIKPELKIYEDIINGYKAVGDQKKVCLALKKASNHYPSNKTIQQLKVECETN